MTIKCLVLLSAASPTPHYTRRYPLSYVMSGYYVWGVGNLDDQGSNGIWWSTAAYSDSGAYYLVVNSSYLNPQSNSSKANGFSLRSTIARRYPLSYVLSGRYFWNTIAGGGYDKLDFQGTYGFWWTSAPISATGAYSMGINSGGLAAREDGKAAGFPLRSIKARRYPLSYVFSGGYGGSYGGLVYQSSEFDIWASTSYSSDRAYYLATASGIINFQNDTTKLYSFALRQRRDQLRILSL